MALYTRPGRSIPPPAPLSAHATPLVFQVFCSFSLLPLATLFSRTYWNSWDCLLSPVLIQNASHDLSNTHPPHQKNPSTTDSSFMTDNVRYILLKSTVRLLFFFLIRTCDSRNNIIIIFLFLFYMFTYHHEVKSRSLVSTVNNNSADCGAIKRKKEECAEVFPSH